jgi:NADPH:quinone reductase
MKAIRVHEFGGPEVMGEEDISNLQPGEGQVLVTVKAAGVNPVDVYIRSGQYAKKPALPYTPGMDAAGIVESVGREVTSVQQGDRVYVAGSLSGTYAEHTLCLESHVHPLPAQVSFSQGAAMGVPYGVAYRALFNRAAARKGETVLVHGATGGVGTAAMQLARAAGMRVIGTAGTPDGLDFLLRQGADHAVDHRDRGHVEKILDLTDGAGVDVVLEMLANVNLGSDLKMIAYGGRIVIIGSRGPVEIDPRDAMIKDAAILGVLLFNASEGELSAIHRALGDGLHRGDLKPVIGQEMPLSAAAKAHDAVLKPHACGKIVLIP